MTYPEKSDLRVSEMKTLLITKRAIPSVVTRIVQILLEVVRCAISDRHTIYMF